jgi:hypothetical protein
LAKVLLKGKLKLDNSSIKIRVVKFSDNKWKEYSPGLSKAYRVNLNKDSLVSEARKRAISNEELFIVFDSTNSIDNWECY